MLQDFVITGLENRTAQPKEDPSHSAAHKFLMELHEGRSGPGSPSGAKPEFPSQLAGPAGNELLSKTNPSDASGISNEFRSKLDSILREHGNPSGILNELRSILDPTFRGHDVTPTVDPTFRGHDVTPTVDPTFRGHDVPPTVDPTFRGHDVPPTVDPTFRGHDVTPTVDPTFRGHDVVRDQLLQQHEQLGTVERLVADGLTNSLAQGDIAGVQKLLSFLAENPQMRDAVLKAVEQDLREKYDNPTIARESLQIEWETGSDKHGNPFVRLHLTAKDGAIYSSTGGRTEITIGSDGVERAVHTEDPYGGMPWNHDPGKTLKHMLESGRAGSSDHPHQENFLTDH
jgi:hypothetical protein